MIAHFPSPTATLDLIRRHAPASDVCGRTLAELMATADKARRLLQLQVASAGLTDQGWETLSCLADSPEAAATPGEIAEKIGLSRAMASQVLARLEGSQLIMRRRDLVNRRRVRVTLTAMGRVTFERAKHAFLQALAQLGCALDPEQLRLIELACGNVNRAVQRLSLSASDASESGAGRMPKHSS